MPRLRNPAWPAGHLMMNMSRQAAFSFDGTASDQPDYMLESAVSGMVLLLVLMKPVAGPGRGR